MYEELPIESLISNPHNANRISRMFIKKLRHNIRHLGFYETLTVRPHPDEKGKFQILNGHARLNVLRELQARTVKCDIWNVTDSQAGLFLAILNRLRGSDVPELRMNLLFELLKQYPKAELAAHIPETNRYLSNIEEIGQKDRFLDEQTLKPEVIIISFYLSPEQHCLVSQVLEAVAERFNLQDSSQAFVELASLYLKNVFALS